MLTFREVLKALDASGAIGDATAGDAMTAERNSRRVTTERMICSATIPGSLFVFTEGTTAGISFAEIRKAFTLPEVSCIALAVLWSVLAFSAWQMPHTSPLTQSRFRRDFFW
jgi:hypothetical protein